VQRGGPTCAKPCLCMMQKTPSRNSTLPAGRKQPSTRMGEILGQTTLAKQLDSGSITSTRNADAVLDSFDFWLFNIVTPPQ
jgi:hypothetical protein